MGCTRARRKIQGRRPIFNWFLRAAARVFLPSIAKEMEREGQLDFRDKPKGGEYDLSDYLRVEDNGSDVTIFSFAGMAVLFAGMPQFEFRKMLVGNGKKYNLVFLRDIHRAAYTLAPDGTNRGWEFFPRIVKETMEQLGSKYNVAMGASAGGAGAFYNCAYIPFNQVVTFSPGFPQDIYINGRVFWQALFDIKKLFREPAAYFEVLMVVLGARYVWRRLCRINGHDQIPDITAGYLAAKPKPPRATIFYGMRCAPDTEQAMRLKDIPSIKLVPVNSGRHNCAADLKKQGLLAKAIADEIEAGVAEWRNAGAASDQVLQAVER